MSRGPEGKPIRKLRCAVYTRKSTEEGLDKEFNSLDAQREACEAYIASQRSEGWVLVRDPYDDGGFSGGTLERPALQRLLADIEEGLVDVVVVYKIDRLSRSLMDFSKLVEVFDRAGVTFVSVTQSFNTTTSMGRLTLNILLCFAQFEREVIGERVRDKIAASRQKGMWMGGSVPLGYVVREPQAGGERARGGDRARRCSSGSCEIGSATVLAQELRAEGVLTTKGRPIDKGDLYKCLSNRTYLGLAIHKGTAYPGEHEAIVAAGALGQGARDPCRERPHAARRSTRAQTPALLKGLIFGPTGAAMSPTHTRKGDRLYRYYVSQDVLKHGPRRLPDRPRAGGGDRGGGHRSGARRVPAAGDRRRHLARGAGRAGRRDRGRGPGGADRSSTRCGTSCSRPSRRGSCGCWSSGWTCTTRASTSASA